MDCITVDFACIGELTSNGFVFAVKKVMCTEASHSYSCLATKGTCKASNCSVERAHGSVTGYNGEVLMSTVAHQHVPIAIEAGLSSTTAWAVWKLMKIQQSRDLV